jgi:RNA polymerase sigma-70 factor, ECF subfamily
VDARGRDVILAKLRERIVAYATSHIGRDIAEDVAQEVLMVLEERYSQLDQISDLLPLSLQIARFKMMSLRRKAARHGEYDQVSVADIQLPDVSEDPASRVERREMLDRLARAIGQIGGRCREMLRLKLEGRSFAEIQKIFGVRAINTIYTWDHRCRKHLLELMGGDWEARK